LPIIYKKLLPFIGNPRINMAKGLPFELQDYLQLIEFTGRCIRADIFWLPVWLFSVEESEREAAYQQWLKIIKFGLSNSAEHFEFKSVYFEDEQMPRTGISDKTIKTVNLLVAENIIAGAIESIPDTVIVPNEIDLVQGSIDFFDIFFNGIATK
jgi:hypothetical protein